MEQCAVTFVFWQMIQQLPVPGILDTRSLGWQPPAWTAVDENHHQLLRPKGAVVMAGQDSFASVLLLLGEQTGCFFLSVALMNRSPPCVL